MKKDKQNISFAHISASDTKDSINLEMTYTLIKNLPNKVHGSKHKTISAFKEAWRYMKPTISALKYDKWICFNSKNRVSLMIFDIDRLDLDFNEQYKMICDLVYEPTWFIRTDNGYQFGYVLQNHLFLNNKSAVIRFRAIKLEIIKLLGCDIGASVKNYGFMRNPLATDLVVYNPTLTVEFNDFNHIAPVQNLEYFKSTNKNNRVLKTVKGFELGKRHKFLLIRGMEIANNNKLNSIDSLISEIAKYQDEMKTNVNKLDIKDIENISKSVYSYWEKNLIFKYIGKIENKITPREKISIFEEYGRWLDEDEFNDAVRKRRVEHVHITNKIRPKNHLLKCNKIRQKNAKNKAKKVYKYLVKNNIKINKTNMSKFSKKLYNKGLSRNSINCYFDEILIKN